jgi:hypothetical protein
MDSSFIFTMFHMKQSSQYTVNQLIFKEKLFLKYEKQGRLKTYPVFRQPEN